MNIQTVNSRIKTLENNMPSVQHDYEPLFFDTEKIMAILNVKQDDPVSLEYGAVSIYGIQKTPANPLGVPKP